MSKQKLNDLYKQAAETPGVPVEIGRIVVCDYCDDDFTDNDTDCGGHIFQSKACCPFCEVRMLPRIKMYGEEHFIRAKCPPGKPFADFVREYRGAHAAITITKF